MRVIFHREAQAEMIEHARYYEAKSEGLGSDFLTAVEKATQRIKQFPKAGRIVVGGIRKRLVSGFPFNVLYEIQPDRIYIAAVMHQHRRPGYWLKRLE